MEPFEFELICRRNPSAHDVSSLSLLDSDKDDEITAFHLEFVSEVKCRLGPVVFMVFCSM